MNSLCNCSFCMSPVLYSTGKMTFLASSRRSLRENMMMHLALGIDVIRWSTTPCSRPAVGGPMVTALDPSGTDLGLAQLFNFPVSIDHSAPRVPATSTTAP